MAEPRTREARYELLLSQGYSPAQATDYLKSHSKRIRFYMSTHPELFSPAEKAVIVERWTSMQYQMIFASVSCWLAFKATLAVYPRLLAPYKAGVRYGVLLAGIIGPSVAVYRYHHASIQRTMDGYIYSHWDEVNAKLAAESRTHS